MPRFAANLSTLFTELPFRARFAAARMAGFDAIEFQFAYDQPGELLLMELTSQNLQAVLINAPPGLLEDGDRGLAAIEGRETEFELSIAKAMEYARGLHCKQVHVLAGVLPPTSDPDRAMVTYIANIKRAAQEAARHEVSILIEPINRHDIPGYFLSDMATAKRVIESVAEHASHEIEEVMGDDFDQENDNSARDKGNGQ